MWYSCPREPGTGFFSLESPSITSEVRRSPPHNDIHNTHYIQPPKPFEKKNPILLQTVGPRTLRTFEPLATAFAHHFVMLEKLGMSRQARAASRKCLAECRAALLVGHWPSHMKQQSAVSSSIGTVARMVASREMGISKDPICNAVLKSRWPNLPR